MKPLMDFDLTDNIFKAEGVQKIRQFIGSCNFYRRHLRNFTEASAPLTDLIKKETPWRWGPIERQANRRCQEENPRMPSTWCTPTLRRDDYNHGCQ